MNEAAASLSFFFLLHHPYSSRLSFSLFLSFSLCRSYSLSSRSPLISRRQVGGGDDSEAEMEQLESGGLVCLSLPLLPSPDRSFIPVPSSTHWSPLHFVGSRPFPPSLYYYRSIQVGARGGGLGVNRVMRAHEYITNGDREKCLFFFHEKFSTPSPL